MIQSETNFAGNIFLNNLKEIITMKTKLFFTVMLSCSIIFASAQIIHVPADQTTIQEGINAASTGGTVLVAEGTYYENINFWGKAITVTSNFITTGDTNTINNTIINGSRPSNPDYASVVSFTTGEDTTSIISGFTITGGTGLLDASIPARLGGGIVCINASAKISHNKIIANEVDHQTAAFGAGIACTMYLQSKWVVIEHNVIADNYNHAADVIAQGGGIYIGENTGSSIALSARVSHNTIENNSCYSDQNRADGGGIKIEGSDGVKTILSFNNNLVKSNYIRGSSTRGAGLCGIRAGADITNNVFSDNYIDETSIQFRGAAIAFKYPYHMVNIIDNQISNNLSPIDYYDCRGAVSIMDGYETPVKVDKNIFTNNVAYDGAGFYSRRSYNLIVSNNIFSGNAAYRGAALSSYQNYGDALNQPLIVNNTFIRNTATYAGAAIRFDGELKAPIIFNCIFWENEAPLGKDIRNASALELVVSYSNIDTDSISGLWNGEGNINNDPLFIDAENGDFHLAAESPCIDAGDPSSPPDPDGTICDMGTYYFDQREIVALLATDTTAMSFTANWQAADDATGYLLDVATDENFTNFVFQNQDVGNVLFFAVNNLNPISVYYYRVRANYFFGRSGYSNTIVVATLTTVEEFKVQSSAFDVRCYPNPFQSQTTISFTCPDAGFVNLEVCGITGRRITTLHSGLL